ncbi:A24 family peptidase [Sphingomonas sp. LY29]|uniref:prepilin peptidase n=1 Tax=Sphingomonas sp. LY29 TaxID=3095341 RepID=UPI002D797E10|nr:A24 family peptidase [Sphingomonas sp. LY29]WRP26820.1 A24 family peptidase [Sphingomonas sp. LY29]
MTLLAPLLGAVAGAIVGSFLATLCLRWPKELSVVGGRSRCDGCGRVLGALDLIPVLSFAIQRGRCRTCSAPIDPVHLRVEIAAAVLGGGALALAPNLAGAAVALLWWQLLALAVLDWRHHWLPDRLTALLAVSGIALGGVALNIPLIDRGIGAVVGFLSLAAIALAYRRVRNRQGMGGGDPKLFGAIGAWVGWMNLPFVLLAAALLGLGIAIVRRHRAHDQLPLGTFLAIAAIGISAVSLWRGGFP